MIVERFVTSVSPAMRRNPAASDSLSVKLAADRRGARSRVELVQRVRAEFTEMPGQCLTVRQASRLFGIPPDVCTRVLGALEREGVLRQTPDGRYIGSGSTR